MTTDPKLWIDTRYLKYRKPTKVNGTSGSFYPQDGNNSNNNTSQHYSASQATRVYLFGDRTWRSTQAERLQILRWWHQQSDLRRKQFFH